MSGNLGEFWDQFEGIHEGCLDCPFLEALDEAEGSVQCAAERVPRRVPDPCEIPDWCPADKPLLESTPLPPASLESQRRLMVRLDSFGGGDVLTRKKDMRLR